MKTVKYIFFFLCIYIYIYNPIFQVLGFGLIKVLLFFSIAYLVLNKSIINIIQNLKIELLFTSILIFYTIPLALLGDGSTLNVPYSHLIWFLECFIIPVFLLTYFNDIFQKNSWEFIIVLLGSIASIITLYLILNPSTNMWLRENVIIDTLDSFVDKYDFRGFSIAESSSYSYGIIQGLVFSICLVSIKKSSFYAIPLIPLLISILFNARIGFSVVIISILLLLIFNRLKFKAIIVVLILAYITYFLYNNSGFVNSNSKSMEWGLGFFNDTFSFLSGESSDSNYNTLANEMFFFPKTILGVIFGEGRSVFGIENGSDIGYVIQIFIGGAIYLIFMFSFILYMFKKNIKLSTDKIYPILFVLSLLVVNVKGNAFFVPNGFFRVISLYYIYCIYNSRISIPE